MQSPSSHTYHAWIDEPDPDAAVAKIIAGAGTDRPSLTMLFVDPQYDLDALAEALRTRLKGPIMACTTAGELIGDRGYAARGMSVAAIASDELTADVCIIDDVRTFGMDEAQRFNDMLRESGVVTADEPGRFGVLLVDGMSHSEERLSALIHGAGGGIPLVGGSAGDGGQFVATRVFDGHSFRTNIAAFAMVRTSLPYTLFRFQHFEPCDQRMVVTKADPANRRLIELDGAPARAVYCNQIGSVDLDQTHVARHPLLLQCGNEYYARSIRSWDEQTLTLFCSVEEGMVIRIGRARDLVDTLRTQLDGLVTQCGATPTLTVSFDCVLRRMEIQKQEGEGRFRELLSHHPIVGFSTYGEQFDGMHINQTMTGFAIAA